MERWSQFGWAIAWAVQALGHVPAGLLTPRRWLHPLYEVLFGTLPMAAVAGLALGLVAWLHLHQLLAQFQSIEVLPSTLALTVVWEFGPVAAGLMAAARLGAGWAAELAALKVTEQVDAAAALGVPILPRLVVPRIIAALMAMPLLTVFIDFLAVGSGYLAEAVGGSLTWRQYLHESLRLLTLREVIPATLKTSVFGLVVALVACWHGLSATAGADSVGAAATKSVVHATLGVLVVDILLVRAIQVVLY